MMQRILLLATLYAAQPLYAAEPDCDVGTRQTWLTEQFAPCAFTHITELFPSRAIRNDSRTILDLKAPRPDAPPGVYAPVLDAYTGSVGAQGIIVVRDGEILFEKYGENLSPQSNFLAFSITKPMVSTLVGAAIHDGYVGSVDDPVIKYLPEVAGSTYELATVRDLLEMNSGTSFDESYTANSSISEFISIVNRNEGGLYEFSRSFGARNAPGTRFTYASANTEVLGELLRRASGQTLAEYMSSRVWIPIGAEADARWILDADDGKEISAGGVSARLRDLARFGMFVAHGGVSRDGAKSLPEGWISESTIPQRQSVGFGNVIPGAAVGYGYSWWLLPPPHRIIFATGMYGQFLIISPETKLVMVVAGAWPEPFMQDRYDRTFAAFLAVEQAILKAERAQARPAP